jgi:hypothetical protein
MTITINKSIKNFKRKSLHDLIKILEKLETMDFIKSLTYERYDINHIIDDCNHYYFCFKVINRLLVKQIMDVLDEFEHLIYMMSGLESHINSKHYLIQFKCRDL